MKNIHPMLNYTSIKAKRVWDDILSKLLQQVHITFDELSNIKLWPCNSIMWKKRKITCKKTCLKAANDENLIIWLKVQHIFYIANCPSIAAADGNTLFLEGR